MRARDARRVARSVLAREPHSVLSERELARARKHVGRFVRALRDAFVRRIDDMPMPIAAEVAFQRMVGIFRRGYARAVAAELAAAVPERRRAAGKVRRKK